MDAASQAIRTALASGEPIHIRARGTSMRPLIPSGTLVLIAPAPMGTRLRVGDVVLTSVGAGLVMHRIVGLSIDRGSQVVVTRGDGRRTADAPVAREAVLGRVVEATLRGRVFRLERPWWRALGYAAARVLPHLWFLRRG